MASRCAVMNRGLLQQVATPSDLYEFPNSRFVADFIGQVNMFEGRLAVDESPDARGGGEPRVAGAGVPRTTASARRLARARRSGWRCGLEKIELHKRAAREAPRRSHGRCARRPQCGARSHPASHLSRQRVRLRCRIAHRSDGADRALQPDPLGSVKISPGTSRSGSPGTPARRRCCCREAPPFRKSHLPFGGSITGEAGDGGGAASVRCVAAPLHPFVPFPQGEGENSAA